jgi:hypothetical protein
VQGLKCRVSGEGFRVQDSKWRVHSVECRLQGSSHGVQGLEYRVGVGFRVQGLEFRF